MVLKGTHIALQPSTFLSPAPPQHTPIKGAGTPHSLPGLSFLRKCVWSLDLETKLPVLLFGPSEGEGKNFRRRGSKKWDYCFKGSAQLRW